MAVSDFGWSRDEYLAYLLIFCMKADFHEEDSEVEFIQSKVGQDVYKYILKEFRRDNDYHRVQKIQMGFEDLGFTDSEKEEIIREIQELFESDGQFDIVEMSNFLTLKRLLIG